MNWKMNEMSERTLKLWGAEAQTMMATEEAAELIHAICKHTRKPDIENKARVLDEICDVFVTLNTLRIAMGFTEEEIFRGIERKVERTNERMDRWEEDGILEDPHY